MFVIIYGKRDFSQEQRQMGTSWEKLQLKKHEISATVCYAFSKFMALSATWGLMRGKECSASAAFIAQQRSANDNKKPW